MNIVRRAPDLRARLTVPLAALASLALAGHAAADRLDDALRLVPADAVGAFVVPSLKSASDDLQQAIDRMGRAETALGGRPIDLLKAQLGIGPGFDDRGPLVGWTMPGPGEPKVMLLLSVTDADAFVAATFTDAPELGAGAMRGRASPAAVWVRKAGKRVVVASAPGLVERWEETDGFAAALERRLGRRGMEIVRTADLFAWGSGSAMQQLARTAREQGAIDEAAARMLPPGKDEAGPAKQLETIASARMRSAQVLEQVSDGLVAVDFDALAVGIRAFARFAPDSEIAKAMPAGSAAARDASAVLAQLPDASFYAAVGVDFRAMGGFGRVREFLGTIPGSERLQVPEWLDAVKDKVRSVQVAAYPSKLGIAVGGILNDASFVVGTDDPAAVKASLRTWVMAQAGERQGIRSEPTWEDERALKDGSKVSAFAVKETAVAPGADLMQRLVKQLVVGSRGLHGFAREVPGALVVTFSQRTDVLDRATAAASGTAKRTLAANGTVRAMNGWLVPNADAVLMVGVGQLLGAARQVAAALPGGSAEMVPMAPEGLEPVALAMRSGDASWEAAVVVPSGVLGVAFDAARRGAAPVAAPGAEPPAAAPAPAPNAPNAP